MKRASGVRTTTVERELVLVGGGHSHVAVIRHFGMYPLPGLRVTVVSRDVHTPYSGMLPGLIAGHYRIDDSHIDLRALCEANDVRLVHATVGGVDRERRLVRLDGRPELRYDWLSINSGSRPALHTIAGAAAHGVALKPIDRFLERWQALLLDLAANPRPLALVVVGGGAAGVEVALACRHRLRAELGERAAAISLAIVCAGEHLLETHNARVRHYFDKMLARRGIHVHRSRRVLEATVAGLRFEDDTWLAADFFVWAIHAGAAQWPRESGIDCDDDGFIRVQGTLRSRTDPRLFAAGDAAALPVPLAKSGVYAVRAGVVLADNLRRAVLGKGLRPYLPQKRYLSLLSTGEKHAVASRGPLFATGRWVWHWKDRIDRAFMQRYRARPIPPTRPGAEPAMRCGGCAAKLGSEILSRVLADIVPQRCAGLEHGIGSAEDASVLLPPAGQQLVQSVDYFRAFSDDPYLLGRIAALHCLGDLYAMGARPHSALAIATIAFAEPAVMEHDLRQLMHGALETLAAEDVALLGGHSSEGAELAFGLSVNGFADPRELLLKSGLLAGHALILTKALGSGTLFAANMAAAAEGRWIDAAIEGMLCSPRAALGVLRAHELAACTDVTGFGLLGHLLEMLRASSIGARLRLADIPLLAGALECLSRGYRSSLYPSNRAHLAALTEPAADSPLIDALLDPQTAGGLLAAVPMAQAEACVAALHVAGYPDAAIIAACDPRIAPGRVELC